MKFKILFIYILLLFITFTNFNVNAEFIDSTQFETLYWLSDNFNIGWNFSNYDVCNNIGIICNPLNTTILSLIIDSNLTNGPVIKPLNNSEIPGLSQERLYLPDLTSLIIKNKNSQYNILEYIYRLPKIEYLEITDVLNLPTIPIAFTSQCPLLSTVIIKSVEITNITDSFFTNGTPFKILYLDFPSKSFNFNFINNIQDLHLNLDTTSSELSNVLFDDIYFKNLTNLYIKTDSPIEILNIKNLKNVTIACSNNENLLYNFNNSIQIDNLYFDNCGISNLKFTNTNLTSLEIIGGEISSSSPIIYPNQLENLKIEKASYIFLPNSTNLPNIRELILTNCFFTNKQIDDFKFLSKINVTNSQLGGNIPQEFCKIKDNDYSNNNFSTIPDCFLCHWSYTSIWFSNNNQNINPSNNFNCSLQVENTNFMVDPSGGTVILNGINLGWLNENSTPGLNMIIPNFQFTFDIPPKSDNKNYGTKTIQFSLGRTIDIEWKYNSINITNVEFIQNHNEIIANLTGIFQGNFTIFINGLVYPSTMKSSNNIEVYFNKTLLEGPLEIHFKSSISFIYKTKFVRNFPTITSASILTNDDNKVTLYGSFYDSNERTDPIVYINNLKCEIVSSNSSTVIVLLPTTNYSEGFMKLMINDNGYVFNSSKSIFYENVKTKQCNEECKNGGTCILDTCQCTGDYYGPSCSFIRPPTDSYSVTTEISHPQASYILTSGISFYFAIQSIQELDFNNNIVGEYNISSWNYQGDKMIDNLGIGSQHTSIVNNATITVSMYKATEITNYLFAGVDINILQNEMKVSMNISNWQYQSSTNTLRVVFKSALSNSKKQDDEQCKSTDIQLNTLSNNHTLISFNIIRNGEVFQGSFIDRMLSNGRISYSRTENLGTDTTDPTVNYVGINMPYCNQCILDPSLGVLIDPSYNNDCSESSSFNWLIPVAVVVPVIGLAVLFATGFIIFKKNYIVAKDGKSFKVYSKK